MKPEDPDEEDIRRQLKGAFPAIDTELQRDLWPAMLRRIQEEPARVIPWYDWVLAACSMVLLAVFPKLAWLFAYHL
jgi:hypothetical protein